MIADISLTRRDDVADRAPAQAREKLIDMRYAAKAANLLTRDLGDEITDLREEKAREEQRLRDLSSGHYARVSEEQIAAQQAKVDILAEKIARLQARYDEARGKWDSLQRGVQSLEGYLQGVSRDSLTMAREAPEPALKKGELAPDALARTRGKIEELHLDLKMIEAAPFPSSVVKSRMRAQIQALAASGEPDVMAAIEGGGQIEFRRAFFIPQLVKGTDGKVAGSVDFGAQIDTAGLVAWLHKDALIAALEREIDANADDASALDDSTRKKKSERAKAEILAAEREEEALVEICHAHGHMVPRRDHADPRAVLGVNGPEPKDSFR